MIEILFDDGTLLAINKSPGLSVHEAPGPGSSVLRELRGQGLDELTPVHRLDKDASGVMLLARTKECASALQRNWDKVEKTYWALCEGSPFDASGVIDAPILEHQTSKPERLENAVKYYLKANPGIELPPLPAPKTSAVHPAGRSAQTEFRVLEKFETPNGKWSWLEIRPRQGRMHQIRVHLAHAGYPLALDTIYRQAPDAILGLKRLPLHATELKIEWPVASGTIKTVHAPLPEDLRGTLEILRSQSAGSAI